jgi:hypothetical protein
MFLAGVDAVDSTQCDDPALFVRVADAMRGVLLRELPDIFARGLHSPYAFEVEGAALSMAGKVRQASGCTPVCVRLLENQESHALCY